MMSTRSAVRRPTARGAGSAVPRAVLPVVAGAVALGASLAAAAAAAGGASPLLVARVVARVALDLSVATVLGSLAVHLLLLPQDDGRRDRLIDVVAVAAGIWTVAAAGTAFLLYLGEAPPISAPTFGPGLVSFLSDVVPGRSWLLAAVVAAVLTTALVAVRSRPGLVLLALLAVCGLIPVASQSAVSDGSLADTRAVGAAALVVQVLLTTWIGAMAAVLVLGAAGPDRSRTVRRSAVLSVVCGASGIVAVLLGGVQRLPLGLPAAAVLLVAVGLAALALIRDDARFLVPQLVLLAAASGLLSAARVVQSAPSAAARTSPAEILTGAPLPGTPTVSRLLGAWQPDALWLLLAAVLLLAYVGGLLGARRTGVRWPLSRTTSWAVGVLLLVWLTSGGPAAYAPVLLSAHLGQHAALATAVPLLLAGGAPLRLLDAIRPDGDPTAARSSLARLARPVPAAVLAAAAFAALYGTGLLRWSVTDAVGTEWSVLQCALTGGLLVHALVHGPRSAATTVAGVLLVAETALAALPAIGPGLLLADWFGAMGWGTDALVDQRAGTLLAWAIAVAVTLVLLGVAARHRATPPPVPTGVPSSPDRLEVPA
jgi:cytochrome c oxidase assembly factor CtaG